MLHSPEFAERLRSIEVLLLDIDHVLHHYCNETYGQSFFDYTVEAAKILSPKARDKTDDELNVIAWESFCESGLTIINFAKHFDDLKLIDLYQVSHQMMIANVLPNYFSADAGRRFQELEPRLKELTEQGLKLYAVTHGSTPYGEAVLGESGHNIRQHFSGVAGLDAFDNPTFRTKRHGVFHVDMIDHFGLASDTNRPRHYPHCAFVDDSEKNLPNYLGMLTVLPDGITAKACFNKKGHLAVRDVTDFFDLVLTARKVVPMPQARQAVR